MIRVKYKWGLPILECYFEPDDRVQTAVKNNFHVKGRIYTYTPIESPVGYALARQKLTSCIVTKQLTADAVLQTFKKNYRNEIRKTGNDTAYQVVATEGLSQAGYNLYRDFETKAGRRYLSAADAQGLWLIGSYDSQPMSGVFLLPVDPVLKVVSIFSTRSDSDHETSKRIGFLSKRIIYEACNYAIRHNYECVDLAYVNDTDPSKKGITDFKRGFGGEDRMEYLYEKKLFGLW